MSKLLVLPLIILEIRTALRPHLSEATLDFQGFSAAAPVTFWVGSFTVGGRAVLCMAGCLAAPPHLYPQDTSGTSLPVLQPKTLPGDEIPSLPHVENQ